MLVISPCFGQRDEIIGMFFLFGEYFLHQPPRGRIVGAEVGDHFAIAVGRIPLGDQVFLD